MCVDAPPHKHSEHQVNTLNRAKHHIFNRGCLDAYTNTKPSKRFSKYPNIDKAHHFLLFFSFFFPFFFLCLHPVVCTFQIHLSAVLFDKTTTAQIQKKTPFPRIVFLIDRCARGTFIFQNFFWVFFFFPFFFFSSSFLLRSTRHQHHSPKSHYPKHSTKFPISPYPLSQISLHNLYFSSPSHTDQFHLFNNIQHKAKQEAVPVALATDNYRVDNVTPT